MQLQFVAALAANYSDCIKTTFSAGSVACQAGRYDSEFVGNADFSGKIWALFI